MHFGEPLDDDASPRCCARRRGATVITADAYGAGEADRILGAALDGLPPRRLRRRRRGRPRLLRGRARGRQGLPALHRSRLRGAGDYAAYLRMATERSLERCGAGALRPAAPAQPRPHRLHERGGVGRDGRAARRRPDATSSASRPGRRTASRSTSSTAFERFGDRIDWAMVILNPLEPWPASSSWTPRRATACGSSRASSTTAASSGTTCCPGTRFAASTTAASARGLDRGGRERHGAHAPDRRSATA
jgi:hypothetical protein